MALVSTRVEPVVFVHGGASAWYAGTRVLERYAGYGGLILVDKAGEVGIARSASAMPHAVARSDGPVVDGE